MQFDFLRASSSSPPAPYFQGSTLGASSAYMSQIDRYIDRYIQIDKQTDKQIDRSIIRQIETYINRQIAGQRDRQITNSICSMERNLRIEILQIDRQIDIQIDIQIYRQIDRQSGNQIDICITFATRGLRFLVRRQSIQQSPSLCIMLWSGFSRAARTQKQMDGQIDRAPVVTELF